MSWFVPGRATAAAFFARKKSKLMRMVQDCRSAIQMRRRAPHSFLATACGLSIFIFSGDWVDACSTMTGGKGAKGVRVFGASVDLVEELYHFLAEEVSKLSRPWASLIGVTSQRAAPYSMKICNIMLPLTVTPCFGCAFLSEMGRSWALFFFYSAPSVPVECLEPLQRGAVLALFGSRRRWSPQKSEHCSQLG